MAISPEDEESPVKPRGLWSVMGAAETDSVESSDDISRPVDVESVPAMAEESSIEKPLRGLFSIMPQAVNRGEESAILRPTDARGPIAIESDRESARAEPSPVDTGFELVTHSQLTQPMPPDWLNGAHVSVRHKIDQDVRQVRGPVICGIASILLSFLALRPEVWLSLPAAFFGFAAIIRGCLVFTTQNVQRGRKTPACRAAVWAVVLGTVGAFLAPVLMSCGHLWRESIGTVTTAQRPIAGDQ